MKAPKVGLAAIAAVTLALVGCSSGTTATSSGGSTSNSGGSGNSANAAMKICVYTHGDGGGFWSVAKKGAEQAAKDLGVTLDYQESNNDPQKQAQLIEAGVSGGCKALAVSAPAPDAIKDALKKATAAGIPIVTMNSGSKVFKDLGAFTHIGQDEYIAGQEAGKQVQRLGVHQLPARSRRPTILAPGALRRGQEHLRQCREPSALRRPVRHGQERGRDPGQADG